MTLSHSSQITYFDVVHVKLPGRISLLGMHIAMVGVSCNTNHKFLKWDKSYYLSLKLT